MWPSLRQVCRRTASLVFGPLAVGPMLVLLLLVTATVDLVGHDHHGAPRLDGYTCVVDHGHAMAQGKRPASTPTPELTASGHSHQHHCLGCRLQSQRHLGPKSTAATAALLPLTDASRRPNSALYVRAPLTSRSLRGPPSA